MNQQFEDFDFNEEFKDDNYNGASNDWHFLNKEEAMEAGIYDDMPEVDKINQEILYHLNRCFQALYIEREFKKDQKMRMGNQTAQQVKKKKTKNNNSASKTKQAVEDDEV